MSFPEGLFGVQIQITFVFSSHTARSSLAFMLKFESSKTLRYSTLLISAQTLYIPYVGSIATTLSLTERNKEIDLIKLLEKTKYGKDGMGGLKVNGLMYVGYPR